MAKKPTTKPKPPKAPAVAPEDMIDGTLDEMAPDHDPVSEAPATEAPPAPEPETAEAPPAPQAPAKVEIQTFENAPAPIPPPAATGRRVCPDKYAHKRCDTCKQPKQVRSFDPDPNGKFGVGTTCRTCIARAANEKKIADAKAAGRAAEQAVLNAE